MNKLIYAMMMQCVALVLSVNVMASEQHKISYGNVKSVLITTADSDILQNTIIGGALGMAIGDNTLATIDGAAAGFAITSIIEGDRRVFLYSIDVDGEIKKIAMEEGGIGEGRCVAIETDDNHTNVRAVSSTFCLQSGHKALSSEEVVELQQSQAEQCKAARQAALKATTDADIDDAMVKVRALCE
ncbi:hypothetical protein E2K93_00455 [Thalassotalea sp. HSM 43]|uniref:hypothetical protein n=1 Tax=Thalassotalea sp. HSM 43 TaxID=2552945 RepID=UPI0010813346|nr:hypothetical protein [Thalassotalea sp. HSM 43]QBY02933.1 hypothetical protein E2K93_00455 [Thalassotalea sp. HSM 43]